MAFRERVTSFYFLFFKVFILAIGINILEVIKTVWTLYNLNLQCFTYVIVLKLYFLKS